MSIVATTSEITDQRIKPWQ